jgi:GTP-binding protein Era
MDFRSGYIAITGRPNVGKSTIMNHLLDYKLSITSPKPQTTRRSVMGIMSDDEAQIIFLDTPGILEPKYHLQKAMMRQIQTAIMDADALAYIIDDRMFGDKGSMMLNEETKIIRELNPAQKPVLLVINKIDLISKGSLLPVMETFHQAYPFETIVPVSAKKNDGLSDLTAEMKKILPLHQPYYDRELLTDYPERFFVAELIREQIFYYYKEEIPYSTEVQIDEFKERDGGKDFISAVIYTERDSQKGILIGRQGKALKEIGTRARKTIESFLGRPVFLELRVKVSRDWRKDDSKLKYFGY